MKTVMVKIIHICGHKESHEIDYFSQWERELQIQELGDQLCYDCQVKHESNERWAAARALSRAIGLPPMEESFDADHDFLAYTESVRLSLLPVIGKLISHTDRVMGARSIPRKVLDEMRKAKDILYHLVLVTDLYAWQALDGKIGEVHPDDEDNPLLDLLSRYLVKEEYPDSFCLMDMTHPYKVFDLALKLAEKEGENE